MKYFVFIFLGILFLLNQRVQSQSIGRRSPNLTTEKLLTWNPVNEFKDYNNLMQKSPSDSGTPVITNIKEGVLFYSKACNIDTQMIVMKLVNSNQYTTKVSWKKAPNMDAEYIVLLPSSEIEGSCNLSLNEVQNKLIFQIQDKEKFQELKKYIISTIEIKKVTE